MSERLVQTVENQNCRSHEEHTSSSENCAAPMLNIDETNPKNDTPHKSEAESKELKSQKENVNSNADEEASVRLALELMRQESWEMHRIMQHETLLAVQDQKRAAMNIGQRAVTMDEDLRLALQLAREEQRMEEQLQHQDLDDIDLDEMTHEELVDLGNRMGDVKQENWGAVAEETVGNLPTVKNCGQHEFKGEKCLVCQCEYEEGEILKRLPCNHCFHNGCISDWLLQNPQCPLCKRSIVTEK